MHPIPRRAAVACLLAVLAVSDAGAATGEDPDWPCVQRKVPEISAGMMWAGPPVHEADRSWHEDEALARLVGRLAARRLPIAEAEEEIDRWAADLGGGRNARLTHLFAGLLQTINAERKEIIAGIERYARKQVALADRIKDQTRRLNALRALDQPSEANREELATLEEKLVWETRGFDERRQSLTYVCESPILLEQRLFALARRIMSHLE